MRTVGGRYVKPEETGAVAVETNLRAGSISSNRLMNYIQSVESLGSDKTVLKHRTNSKDVGEATVFEYLSLGLFP